ncbi:hypothetical protein [Flavobacterium sp.]|uniref:hypothetical protein n=1 Tax=Flavobacterium sp. TaxID=239 RepID=UPI00262932BE|nr:hypothetical protein [Flavobacterium sp.]MDD2984925.1 hypothetical protein [Flavobacterium sp.]
MKIKKIFFLSLTVITAISCKNDTKSNDTISSDSEQNIISAKVFKVTLNAISKKDDDFCFLYTEDSSIDFKEGVWKEVKGSLDEQSIEFLFPAKVQPTQLRLDLGQNLDQEDIVIKSIKFEYNGNEREIKGFEMGVFFRADDSKCTFDPITGVVKATSKEGVRQTPSLYPHESVQAAELPKLFQ